MIEYTTYFHNSDEKPLVLELDGKLDMESSEFLLDTIQGFIEDGHLHCILDFTNLKHITSVGLGTLIRAKSRLQNKQGTVLLASVSGYIADVLRIVHFERVFHIFDDVDSAAAALPDHRKQH